ncbi:MAG: LysR family transcriptional regulator [Rhizobiales bacterium PAR1]|nr:MAG: LysR family transcriptional regulator [Rhizobiales bacterium PAR1]
MNELQDIANFVEVARTGSFTRAALTLGMPGSTLSRRIAELEKSLGIKLFHRTTRRVDLTEAGRLYLSRCEPLMDDARSARAELLEMIAIPRGQLRVSMSPDFGTTYLGPAIASFLRLYPEITLQLDLSPRRVEIVAEGYDLAIRIGAPSEPHLVVRKLINASRSLYASPRFLELAPILKAPADLAKLACIRVDSQGDDGQWILRRDEAIEKVTVRGQVFANNPRMVLQLAAEGLGVVIADDVMAESMVKTGQLVRVLPGWDVPPVPIYLVTASKSLPTKTRLFVNHLHEALKHT